ncbi:MAG: type II toxin-antitoxin system VapC family toxin [Prochlorotrichaceae cyanobacterium]|jgi:predicted nucleic acid-binding protein
MRHQILLDTGPLVALINPRDQMHQWATSEWSTIAKPLLTCEAVIAEACFLLQSIYRGEEGVMILVETGIIQVPFRLSKEATAIKILQSRYKSVPMSFADACMVRMSEIFPRSSILTLDSDFVIYRRNINQVIPVIMPQS